MPPSKILSGFAVIFGAFLSTAASAEDATSDGTFTLERVEADLWRAEYCFDEPVDAVAFTRPLEGMRESHWTSVSDEMKLVHENGAAKLVSKNGSAFRCGSVDVKTYTALPPKNYYAFSPFSTGGMSVYTGYFTGDVQRDGTRQPFNLEAQFKGLPGEQVLGYDLSNLVHQYVYFGGEQLHRFDGLTAVIDPAIPTSARDVIVGSIPEVNAELSTLFNLKPSEPYLVYMAGGELDAFDGTSIKGGTQKNQILFTLKGRGALRIAEEDPTFFAKLTAHEVIHLWQRDIWPGLGDDFPWMHEGSADALAYELMRRTGHYSLDQYENAWSSAQQKCAERLEISSVHLGPAKGNFRVVYECGALVNWLMGALLNPSEPGQGIMTFWQSMAALPAEARATGESETLFFTQLSALGVTPVKIERLRSFLDEQPGNPAAAIEALKSDLGVTGP
ncbi:MAG: hypothetical protein JJ850_09985 [Kordiimonadaceae bacterium]|nr:hypothetical protein [Kordiimonadaceae bacterium]MBO6569462.1 hypothetical protein [Kordiimonadaceae bacterium]MBO6964937.1 hypothetical protein [Kordiimonadaceae bacterium]